MKRLLAIAALVIGFSCLSHAQAGNGVILTGSGTPSGSCAYIMLYVQSTGQFYTCNAGTWSSSGGGGPVPSGSPSGGGIGCTEGTGPSGTASVDWLWCDSTYHDWATLSNNGVKRLEAATVGYNSGSVSASIGSTNIAAAANFPTGQYLLSCDVAVTAVGSSPTLAVTVGWTDITGTARTKTCVTGTVSISDNPITQTITSNGSAAITITQTLAVSTGTWWTTASITRLQ